MRGHMGRKLGFAYLPTYITLHCVRTACTAFPFGRLMEKAMRSFGLWARRDTVHTLCPPLPSASFCTYPRTRKKIHGGVCVLTAQCNQCQVLPSNHTHTHTIAARRTGTRTHDVHNKRAAVKKACLHRFSSGTVRTKAFCHCLAALGAFLRYTGHGDEGQDQPMFSTTASSAGAEACRTKPRAAVHV